MEGARLTAAPRAEEELARFAERGQRHDRLLDLLGDPIAMPGHAVLAVAVEIEAGGVEDHAVTRRQREADVLEDPGLQRNAGADVPGSGQSRLQDAPVVHPAGALPPLAAVDHLAEECVRPEIGRAHVWTP